MKILQKQSGFSMIEVLVSITIFSIISVAVFSMYITTTRNYSLDERIARMQENGRFALNMVAEDVVMLDFWGEFLDPGGTNFGSGGLAEGADCAIDIMDLDTAIMYYNSESASPMFDPHAESDCDDDDSPNLIGGQILAGTNALAIKRVANTPDTSPSVASVYIYTNGTAACLLDNNGTCTLGAGNNYWKYEPVMYFIREDSGTPYLCRMTIDDAGSGRSAGDDLTFESLDGTECIAEGIEQMHIEWGLDTDGDLVADIYDSDITAAEAESAITARIYLLVRTPTEDFSYTNSKLYRLGSLPVNDTNNDGTEEAFNDGYYRRIMSTTVSLRNPRGYIALNQ